MKPKHFFFALPLACLTACSTTTTSSQPPAKADTETVLVTYHVKPGMDGEFQAVLANAWAIYRSEHLVFAQPHVVVWDKEEGGKIRIMELFTWVSHAAPDNVSDNVKQVWAREQALCEARGGHRWLEGGEVHMLTPDPK